MASTPHRRRAVKFVNVLWTWNQGDVFAADWTAYEPAVQLEIEAAFRERHGKCSITAGGAAYTIDIVSMRQMRLDCTFKYRDVQRSGLPLTARPKLWHVNCVN